MEAISTLLALCKGNPLVDSPHKRRVMQSFDISFIASLYVYDIGWNHNNWLIIISGSGHDHLNFLSNYG